MTIKEMEEKVCCTTDVQEACMIGFSEGYDSGYSDGFRDGFEKGFTAIDTEDEVNEIDWGSVTAGTIVTVRNLGGDMYPTNFEAPFVGYYEGLVILSTEEFNDEVLYDGFPPRCCEVRHG